MSKSRRDCGVCGVPADAEVNVTMDGYTVPRCRDHLDKEAYQAESRLENLTDGLARAIVEAHSYHAERDYRKAAV